MKLLYAPIGIGAGLLAGILARKVAERVWSAIDDQEPPDPKREGDPAGKMIVALAIEGAVFAVAKGLADRGARRGFAAFTGRWPG